MRKNILKMLSLVLVVALLLTTLVSVGTVSAATSKYSDYIFDRGLGLQNTFAKLNNGEQINVLYMGGSVTNGTGASNGDTTSWRGIISKWFTDNAGAGSVNNLNVAYGDSGTVFGAYRLNPEVLSQQPDLVFVEFTINDYYNSNKRGFNEVGSTRQFETIVRGIRKTYPDCDIAMLIITEQSFASATSLEGLHKYAKAHENVCIEYNIPSLHVGVALNNEIKTTGNAWSHYFGSDTVHPNDNGYAVYADVVKDYLESEKAANGTNTTVADHALPTMISDYLLDGNVQFIDADEAFLAESEAMGGSGFVYDASSGNLRNIFKGIIKPSKKGGSIYVKFTGTEIAILQQMAATRSYSVSVDGGEFYDVTHDTVRPVVLATGLENKEHTVIVMPTFAGSNCWIQGFFTRDESQARYACKESGNHKFGDYVKNNDATCTSEATETATCTICKQADTRKVNGTRLEHTYKKYKTTDATTSKDGKKYYECEYCGKEKTSTIYKVSKVYLSTTAYAYNGKAKNPSVKVYDSKGKKLTEGEDYTCKRTTKSSKNIGKYKITVTFKGDYAGTKNLYYTIGPKNTSSVKATLYGHDDVKVTWKKVSGASGYKVYYKTSSSDTWSSKTTTSTSTKLSNLSDGKKYDIKVVAYKTISGVKCYNSGKETSIYTLKKITGVKVAKSSGKVKVSWNNISGETGYQISKTTSKSKSDVVSTYKTTSGKSKTISATKGKTYYYKVRAYKEVDGKKIYGPWSDPIKYVRK